jgi:hypothetical protein
VAGVAKGVLEGAEEGRLARAALAADVEVAARGERAGGIEGEGV